MEVLIAPCLAKGLMLSKSSFRLGFAQTRYAISLFPLTSLLKQFYTFEPFEHIPLGPKSTGAS